MANQRRSSGPAGDSTAGRELTEDEKAFAGALKEEFQSRFGLRGIRPFARRVEGIDHSTVSRYLSGQLLASEWFIDRLDQEAREQGSPFSPAGLEDLRRLRAAAMRSSGNLNYRLQATVEELEEYLRNLSVQRCLDREHGDVQQHLRSVLLEDRRSLVARLEQLQRDLTTACNTLAHAEASRERAEAERDRAEQQNAALLRQLKAASQYVQDVQTQLEDSERHGAQMTQTNRGLEQELAVLRRQVHSLQQEQVNELHRAEQAKDSVAVPATATADASAAVAQASGHPGVVPHAPLLPDSGESRAVTLPVTQEPVHKGKMMLWWLAALSSLAIALALFGRGMAQLQHAHGWPATGVAGVAGGLIMLISIVPFTIGRFVDADRTDSEAPGDSSDVVGGFYPMM